ncbi:zf-HC2 domain-containing protein [Paenibacillus terrigena]|uniref:anti-sigma factor family protein n=1 Tax=Paenibacillus terrigena TaxID=369333 RepID=UPI0028D1FB1D|nr:zf-HC2 domain-containing protein [Paenibacillus terrigena]
MMNCPEVMELMNRYLDADLNELESAHLMEHLKQCSDCSEMFERLRHLSAELENMPKVMPKYSLVDAIMPQLDQIDREREHPLMPEKSSQKVVPMKPRFWERLSFRSIGGVVAAGIIVGLFMVTYKPDTTQQADMELMSSQESAAADQKVEMQIDASSPSTSQTPGTPDKAVSQDVKTGGEQGGAVNPDTKSADIASKEAPASEGAKSGSAHDPTKAHQGNTESSGGGHSNQETTDSKSDVSSKSGNEGSDASNQTNPPTSLAKQEQEGGAAGDTQHKDRDASSDATLEDGQPVTVEIESGEPRSFKSEAGDKGGNNFLAVVEYDTANPDSRAECATSNGAYRAVFEKNKFMIYNAKNKEVYQQKLTNGVFSNPLWSEDNKTLTYTFTPRKADGQMGEEQVIQVKVKTKDKEKQQEKGKKSKS